jgi:hypothetical protein
METKMLKKIFTGRSAMALSLCFSGWCQADQMTLTDATESLSDGIEIHALTTETAATNLTPLSSTATEVSEVKPAAPEAPVAVLKFGTPIASSQLNDLRGGFDVVKNDMQLSGVVTNNSAVDVMSGSNYIANGSFANSSGFPMVVQNSGSNVLIQNATIINLQYQ